MKAPSPTGTELAKAAALGTREGWSVYGKIPSGVVVCFFCYFLTWGPFSLFFLVFVMFLRVIKQI